MNKIAMSRVAAALIAASLAPLAASGQENTISFDNIGGWNVRTDPQREYRCFIVADYDNGSAVRAGFNSDSGNFYITVADYRWDWVEIGAPYTVSLQFDEEPAQSFAATGVVLETQYVLSGLQIELPQELEDNVVAKFMYLSEMSLSYEEGAGLEEAAAVAESAQPDAEPSDAGSVAAADEPAAAESSERISAELTLGLFGTQRAVESLEGCQVSMARTARSTEFSSL